MQWSSKINLVHLLWDAFVAWAIGIGPVPKQTSLLDDHVAWLNENVPWITDVLRTRQRIFRGWGGLGYSLATLVGDNNLTYSPGGRLSWSLARGQC